MARRASSSLPAGKVALALGAIFLLIIAGYLFLGRSESFRTTSVFPTKEYLENASSLRGNTYQLEATVDKTLEFSQSAGRLISVEASGGDMLPLLIPKTLNGTNIERGQKLLFRITVSDSGLLTASEIHKP